VIGREDIERDAVVVTCAISAGIHAALTPDHLAEGTGAGIAFMAAAGLLAALAVALTRRPESTAAMLGAVVVLVGLIASYGAAVTTGLPVLYPETEPVDGLAVATKLIEAAGALAAVHVLGRGHLRLASSPRLRGTLT
jgi:peptidoglycan/LPS O-acetylase OafA/YrhL